MKYAIKHLDDTKFRSHEVSVLTIHHLDYLFVIGNQNLKLTKTLILSG